MFDRQGGACAMCGTPDVKLMVDHCHDTGRVRGLLCNRCNIAVAIFDKPDLYRAALHYKDDGRGHES